MSRDAADIAADLHAIADEHGGWVATICREAAEKLVPPPDLLPAEDVAVARLCGLLADRIEAHRGARPKVTRKWVKDMDLLLRRGPLHRDTPEPLTGPEVEAFIGAVFDRLDTPSAKGFCWADQVRSPHALRDHWDQIQLALHRSAPRTRWDDVAVATDRLRAVL
ncbi:MAG: hypothetical protein ACOYOQ_00105 [Microthrixaceae bacterium]